MGVDKNFMIEWLELRTNYHPDYFKKLPYDVLKMAYEESWGLEGRAIIQRIDEIQRRKGSGS